MEINLKRYPTPYPEDLKNMVKSVQSLVGKSVHGVHGHQHQHQLSTGTATSAGTNMEHTHLSTEPYEPPWPLPPKEVGYTHRCKTLRTIVGQLVRQSSTDLKVVLPSSLNSWPHVKVYLDKILKPKPLVLQRGCLSHHNNINKISIISTINELIIHF